MCRPIFRLVKSFWFGKPQHFTTKIACVWYQTNRTPNDLFPNLKNKKQLVEINYLDTTNKIQLKW
jgi:hypothetical protein